MEFEKFLERCPLQQHARMIPEGPYTAILGDYATTAITGQTPVEKFLWRRTVGLLGKIVGRPVGVMDAGAGGAATWSKLSGACKEEIAESNLELFVTNQPGCMLEDYLEVSMGNAKETVVARALYARYSRGLQELSTDLSALFPLPDWLYGKVDIVHERRSVTAWSRIPELHIMRIGQLVSPQGIYMVNRYDTENVCGIMPRSEVPKRIAAISAAHCALQEVYGLTPVDCVEEGAQAGEPLNYRIFKGPEAAPVTVG